MCVSVCLSLSLSLSLSQVVNSQLVHICLFKQDSNLILKMYADLIIRTIGMNCCFCALKPHMKQIRAKCFDKFVMCLFNKQLSL